MEIHAHIIHPITIIFNHSFYMRQQQEDNPMNVSKKRTWRMGNGPPRVDIRLGAPFDP